MSEHPAVPLVQVSVTEAGRQRVGEVLASGRLAQGPVVAELEETFAQVNGVEHCVAVSNGTIALQAALYALGVGPGDEVITTPFTFIATVNSVLSLGATVRFADILEDFTIDAASMAAQITDRTKAVLPVHLFGLPADMDAIHAVATPRGIAVLEDAAQAHGAALVGADGTRRHVGGLGAAGCFSLYATKNLSAGEGGLVTTNDAALADTLRVVRNQGMRARYEYVGWGSNYRMSDLHAAVVVDSAARLHEINEVRNANARILLGGLAGIEGLELPVVPAGRTHVWHQFTVRVTPQARLGREKFLEALRAKGIGCDVFYPSSLSDVPHLAAHPDVHPELDPESLSRTLRFAQEVVSLPVGQHLSSDQLHRVVDVVKEALDG